MVDRCNRADRGVDRGKGRPGEFGGADIEGRSGVSRTRREALVARTLQALRTVSSAGGGRTGARTRSR